MFDEEARIRHTVPASSIVLSRLALGAALLFSCYFLTAPSRVLGEEPKVAGAPGEESIWAPFRRLEGSWEGTIEGRLGEGRGRRDYEFLFDGLYLVFRHASVRLPQEKSPEGDYHRELGVFSLDRERSTIVLREFHGEGFVIGSACKALEQGFVCTSESVESGTGMRSRLTVEMSDPFRFEETFELASPGEELTVYFTNRWSRVPDLRD